jgi:hypothetical protein
MGKRKEGLPTVAEELHEAWKHSRRELIAGRICSIGAMRERRIIFTQAEEAGVMAELKALEAQEWSVQRRRIAGAFNV